MVMASQPNPQKSIPGLLCLGEYGKFVDLSKEKDAFNLI
jgi:hypothetical protein